jgi:SHS2 domain-containing protein
MGRLRARGGPDPTARHGSFPTTADLGLWASASSPSGLFGALGTGLFAILADLRCVRIRESRTVEAEGPDGPALVVAFLSRLLLESADGFLARRVVARAYGRPPRRVVATLLGEPADPARHRLHIEVKAATFHRLEIGYRPPRARVILGI